MKAISKILVLVASAMFATTASAGLIKHDEGRNYDDISKCLVELGLEEGRHFRKKPGGEGIIQLNRAAIVGDSLADAREDIDACWKAPAKKK